MGGMAIWLAENYGAIVAGITISEKQIELAKKIFKRKKRPCPYIFKNYGGSTTSRFAWRDQGFNKSVLHF